MHCISVTYKKAPVDVREKFAWSNREIDRLQNEQAVLDSEYGMVVLSTCNRSEIYFSSDIGMEKMRSLVKSYKDVSDELYNEFADEYLDEAAAKHLFVVTCGMDSMVLGEDEVQRQVKDAYQFAHELGKTGLEMNMLFQGALRCSRKIKAETEIKYLPVSVGTLTANFAAEFASRLGRNANVLMLGASGKIGRVVVKDMLDIGCFNMYCTRRQHHPDFGNDDLNDIVTVVDYDDRYSFMNDADIVVSATKSPHCVIKKAETEANIDDHKDRLLIDLAVPRDIEPEVADIQGISLYDIDYIKTMSEENNRKKAELRNEMDRIIDEVYGEVIEDFGFSLLMAEKKELFEKEPELRKKIGKMRKEGSSLAEIKEAIAIGEFAEEKEDARPKTSPGYFPLMISLADKKVLIVGAGAAAKYKIRSLADAGADLTVLAPELSPEAEQFVDKMRVLRKEYEQGDAEGFDIVVAATNNSAVNEQVINEAKSAGALVCSGEKPKTGDFIFPAILRKKDYQVAISTDGRDPHAAHELKKKINSGLAENLADMVPTKDAR